jgi:hypothetical protein
MEIYHCLWYQSVIYGNIKLIHFSGGRAVMRRKKLIRYSLIVILVLAVCYGVFIVELPNLIWISQRLGIDANWRAVDEHLVRRLYSMSRDDVHAFLNELFFSGVDIEGREPFLGPCDDLYGEYIQMGNLFHPFTYIVCYKDGRVSTVHRVDF